MTRTQLACTSLIASAFLIGALLVVSLSSRFNLESQAQATMVIAGDNVTLMTAKTRKTEEALFVLDNANGRLMIYRTDLPKKQLQLRQAIELETLFSRAAGSSGKTYNSRKGR
jgi:hypothetical protein